MTAVVPYSRADWLYIYYVIYRAQALYRPHVLVRGPTAAMLRSVPTVSVRGGSMACGSGDRPRGRMVCTFW